MSSPTLDKMRREADSLSVAEKFELADHLLLSAHGMTTDNDALWRAEVRNRIASIDNGSEKLIPWSEFEKDFKHLETRSSQ